MIIRYYLNIQKNTSEIEAGKPHKINIFWGVGRNDGCPLEGIDTDRLDRARLNRLCRNDGCPLEGIDTFIFVARIENRHCRNDGCPLEGIDTPTTLPSLIFENIVEMMVAR